MSPVIDVIDVSKSFWGVKALDCVRLQFRRGEVHAVTGENGAGKSTLMKILAGLETPDSGHIEFHGRGISMIHQELLPFPDLSISENICMGREPVCRFPGWLDKRSISDRAEAVLARLGLRLDVSRKMRELSVAEMQTVEIAKALARECDVLIMDEPTSALSDSEIGKLFQVIADLKARGTTIIYISHKMDEIFRICDTVTVLRDGIHVSTTTAAELDEQKLIGLMVGRELAAPLKRDAAPGEVALEVDGLSKAGKFKGVSFVLRRGEVLGLAGLMGAGRTDVAAAIYGLAPGDSGEIRIDGKPVNIRNPEDAIRHGIAMVTEDRNQSGVVQDMPVQHNLTLSSLARFCRGPFIRRNAEAETFCEQVRKFAIKTAGPGQSAKYLSGGNQQKLVLAKALLADPDVLILDEPTRGIDVAAKAEIYSVIGQLAREGKAILMVSSELNEILSLSDRVLVMREGKIAAELQPESTSAAEILKHAMAG